MRGEHIDTRYDYGTDGHVELGDNLLVTEGKLELGEGSIDPHWQLMAYVRACYMQKRCIYRVGQSCLPVILLACHGAFIPLVRVLAAEARAIYRRIWGYHLSRWISAGRSADTWASTSTTTTEEQGASAIRAL